MNEKKVDTLAQFNWLINIDLCLCVSINDQQVPPVVNECVVST